MFSLKKIRNRGGGAGVGLVLPIASISAQQGSIHNRYVAGSGVGASSTFARRAKMYRAATKYDDVAGPTRPTAPTGITAIAGDGGATITFTPSASNGGATILYYRVVSTPDGITASGSSSPILISGLTNGVSYTFTVVAINVAGSSDISAISNAVTPNIAIPTAPTDLVVTDKTLTTISISFTQTTNGSPAITNYSYSLDGGSFTDLSPVDKTSPITITGLSSNTQYSIRLKAKNINGYSSVSDEIVESTYANVNFDRFTTVGASTWTAPDGVNKVEYLVVGGGGGGGGTYSKINVLGNILVTDSPQPNAYWINSANLTNGRYSGRMYYGFNSGQNSTSFTDPIQLTASQNFTPNGVNYNYQKWYNFEMVYLLNGALPNSTNTTYVMPQGVPTQTYSNNISAGSGGGGGGYIKTSAIYPFSKYTVTPGTTYNVYVGAGGSGGTATTNIENAGQDGEASYFDTITASGGAGGNASRVGFNQNGGGGRAYDSIMGGRGGAGGSRNGGAVINSEAYQGNTTVLRGTLGGSGVSINIDNTMSVVYGAGGDGGAPNTVATSTTPANVGKGGEGTGCTINSYATGRDGGSGIVVIKYYT